LRIIDLMHVGVPRVIGCWQVDDVLVDPGPSTGLPALFEALGHDYRPRALLLTHIHLDHAGASGTLARCWPDVEVYVHERGAPHMIDPSRLIESATRLYGDDMERLWGDFVAVPEERLHVLSGGETLEFDAGSFDVAYTPGHASHHVSYLHDGTAFVGDVGGVRITPDSPAIPPTPPPDIDVEAWHASIELVRSWDPERLAMTHFGAAEDVDAHLEEVGARLDRWAALARDSEREQFMASVRDEIRAGAEPGAAAAYEEAAPRDQLYMGLERYWRKRAPGVS
jgi:glyoxylase-like metal-dependent hydrolase (beta-lactamase superfamily II)